MRIIDKGIFQSTKHELHLDNSDRSISETQNKGTESPDCRGISLNASEVPEYSGKRGNTFDTLRKTLEISARCILHRISQGQSTKSNPRNYSLYTLSNLCPHGGMSICEILTTIRQS